MRTGTTTAIFRTNMDMGPKSNMSILGTTCCSRYPNMERAMKVALASRKWADSIPKLGRLKCCG